MSSWDFNSWDYKSSYTYKTLMHLKKILENTLFDVKNASKYNQRSNNKYSSNYNTHDGYEYKYKREGIPNEKRADEPYITPPPNGQSTTVSKRQYKQYQPINNSTKNKLHDKRELDPNTIVKIKKSVVPLYGTGLICVTYALLLPLYRWSDFLLFTLLATITYALLGKLFKGTKLYIKLEEKNKTTGDAVTDDIIKNGKLFSKQIYEANLAIDNKSLSVQINRLQSVCDKIINFVEENPDKSKHIRKFMNYYVPTTLKLLKSYDKLEEQKIQGENIKSAMESIEEAISTIAFAFEKQLDSLFADEAMDISTDISVLENVLSQEGLLDSDFKNKSSKKN